MSPKLQISALLLKRLEQVKQQSSACLFGVFYSNGTLLALTYTMESTIGQMNHEQVQHQFPAELDLCGLVKFGDCTDAEAHLTDIFKDVDITDNPVLLNCELGTLVGLRASIYMHGKLQEIPYEVMDEQRLYNDFCFTRLRCSLNILTARNSQGVKQELQSLRKSLTRGLVIFNVESTKIYITSQNVQGVNGTNELQPKITMHSLLQAAAQALNKSYCNGDTKQANKKRVGTTDTLHLHEKFGALGCNYDILNIGVLRCRTRQSEDKQISESLPSVLMRVNREESKHNIPLEVEAMAILSKHTPVNGLYNVLIESICRGLRLFEQTLVAHLDVHVNEQSLAYITPRAYHFLPQNFGHFVTCVYIDGVNDDEASMQEKRKRLHRNFGLPITHPYFRRSNRCIFADEFAQFDGCLMPLANVHIGLKPSGVGVNEGKQYLVRGNYLYYHYMQQQMNDKGWGCAYRSLQTICSWYRLQGYTERAVPTHNEIQEYLVRIGDKPQSFINSTQWIGSTEVSMCLQAFANVDSKILHVKSGADMATLGSDLATHFMMQGTPVMIGGGVLAHTILGVDYNSQTGQIKFLILDPHFTGNEDLQLIHAKGWCGWKGVDFWDKRSYYNLCLPQRPIMF